MDEMVSYIFRSMRSSELTLRGVKRVLKNQARRNRNFKRFVSYHSLRGLNLLRKR